MKSSGAMTSIWMATADISPRPTLSEDMTADVCVVGAGIAGLTTAYLLTDEGRSVIVLNDGTIAGGETSRTTAHLVNALDDRYFEIERLHGEKGARLAAESHTAAIDRIEAIVAKEKIACDFERLDGYYLCLRVTRRMRSLKSWKRCIELDWRTWSAPRVLR